MLDAQIRDIFRGAGAATVYEAHGRKGDVDSGIHAMTPGLSLAGSVYTVLCEPGDNLALHRAVADAEPGDVLVVSGYGERVGYLGDILAEAAICRGIAGAVIDGGCRDVPELRRMQFPVWARCVAIRAASKTRPGTLQAAIKLGGVDVAQGDLIVADDDGVCVVSGPDVDNALDAAKSRLAQEAEIRTQLRRGSLTLDLLDLRKYLPAATAIQR